MIVGEAAALSVERRLRDLGLPEDEDDIHDAASRAAAQRFLHALGSYARPSVFVLPCGHYRLVWLERREGVFEQFAVSFTGTGSANVVYSAPGATPCRSARRMVGGGLVALRTSETRLLRTLLDSGHDAHVREGVVPTR